ncbi:MAG: clan AA aspartic protease [Saprospiraceae bacterium]|nr:clan AA aspartic protease [Saprospiraceae bacterium]
MKKIILPLIIFMIGTSISGQTFNLNQGGFASKDYLIELPFQNIKGKIILDVEINLQSFKFILDTGAPTAISIGLSEKPGIDIVSSQDLTDINGNKSTFRVAKIDQLKLGQTSVLDIPAVVFEENLLTQCFEVDGIIGSNLLRESVIQFDEKSGLIRIADNKDKLDLSQTIASDIYIDQQSSPVFTIALGDKATEMVLFDTGASELYAMSNAHMKKFKRTKTFSKQSESRGSTSIGINGLEQQSRSYRLSIPELTVQGKRFSHVLIETASTTNSRIGSRFLQYGELTIDYKNSKSYFRSYAEALGSKERFWTVSPTFMNGVLVVGRIWTKALPKNISVGDRIVAINGINTEDISDCSYLLNPLLSNVEVATIKVQNSKGVIQEIEIRRSH